MPTDIQLEEEVVRVIGGSLVLETGDGEEIFRVDGADGSLEFAANDSPLFYVFKDEAETEDRPIVALSEDYPDYGLQFQDDTTSLVFQGEGDPVLTIGLSNKMVGIGTNEPQYKLHVEGAVAGVESFKTLSDARFKRAVEPVEDALDTLLGITGVTYEYDETRFEDRKDVTADQQGRRRYGFVGQDLEEVVPEVVSEDDRGRRSVEQSSLVPLLVEALKEQDEKIEKLNSVVEDLRNRVNDPKSSSKKT